MYGSGTSFLPWGSFPSSPFICIPLSGFAVFLLYLPVPVMIGATWFSHSLFDRFERWGSTWKLLPAYNCPWFWLYVLYYVSMIGISIAVLLYHGQRTSSTRVRRQVRVIAGAAALTLVVGTFLDFVLTSFPSYPLPPLGPLSMGLYVGGLWYAIYRYDFLGPRPDALLEEMLENFGDFVFLLDEKYRIRRINRPAREVFFPSGATGTELFPSIALNVPRALRYLEEVRRDGSRSDSVPLDLRSPVGTIHASGMIYKFTGSVKEPEGYLVLARRNPDRKR